MTFSLIPHDNQPKFYSAVKEIPLVIQKVSFANAEGFIIIRVDWSNKLKAEFPDLDIGYNRMAKSEWKTVTVKGKLGYKPNEGETIMAVGLSFDSHHEDYGVSFKAKQLYAERLSSFDENGKVILNENFTNFENLSRFLSTAVQVKGLRDKSIQALLEKIQTFWNVSEVETVIKLTELIQQDSSQFVMVCRQAKGRLTANQEQQYSDIAKQWFDNLHVQNVYSELAAFGFTQTEAEKLVKHFGNGVVDVLKNNPYEAIAVRGIGWGKADSVGLKVGIKPNDMRRIRSGVEAYYQEITTNSGDTLIPARETFFKLCDKFGFTLDQDKKLLQNYMTEKFNEGLHYKLYTFNMKGEKVNYFTNKNDWNVEAFLAKRLCEIEQTGRAFTRKQIIACKDIVKKEEKIRDGRMVKLDPSQEKAIITCLKSPLSILTGGAGCGKTTILKRLIECAKRLGLNVTLCSPTGKAAKRMTESVNMKDITASTIHTLLGFGEKPSDEKVKSGQVEAGAIFNHNRKNPINTDWLFVDESSMTDIYLARSLLDALPDGARVTFIGDPNQLPSVQKGCFFFDCIESKRFAVARLTVTHRQANGNDINDVAHAILTGDVKALQLRNRQNVSYTNYDAMMETALGGDYLQKQINQTMVDDLVQSYKKLVQQYGVENVQVLTPARQVHNVLSSEALNPKLRAAVLYSHEKGFMKGDRVIGTKNNKSFRNGEVGTITFYDEHEKALFVLFDGESEAKNCYNEKGLLTYAYAITVHKSQGSEYKHVLIPMSISDVFMLNRNWFYTAVTRGKEFVHLFGQNKAVSLATRKQSTRRKTLLRYLLMGIQQTTPSGKPVENVMVL